MFAPAEPNHTAELCGLLPFAILAVSFKDPVSALIVLTGLTYHLYPSDGTKAVDVLVILVLVTYVNVFSVWPWTLPITVWAGVVACLNAHACLWPLHVFGVQLPLALANYHFIVDAKPGASY